MALDTKFSDEVNTAIDDMVEDTKNVDDIVNEEDNEEDKITDELNQDEEVKEDETGDTDEQETTKGSDGDSEDTAENVSDEEEDKGKEAEVIASSRSQVDPNLLSRAIIAGISVADARALPDDESLLRVIEDIEGFAKEESVEDKVSDKDFIETLEKKLDPEVYEPEVIEIFKGLADEIRQQRVKINSLTSAVETSTEANEKVIAQETEQWFDEQVEKLGDDFSNALGAGPYRELDQGSSQFAKREQIANYAAIVLTGYEASGQAPPPRDEVFNAAAKFVLQDEFQKVYEQKLTTDLAEQSDQHIQRAGGKKMTQTRSPEDETAAILDEKFFS